MKRKLTLKVNAVARLTGVSVRALHHYDEIGLLTVGRSPAGYRLYDSADLLRLQQILIGRSLGLSLEDIRRSLDDPAFDLAANLRRQRALLMERASQTKAMIASIEAALHQVDPSTPETDMNPKVLFDGFEPAAHDAEAKARWGETDAYQESARRTGRYDDSQWQAIRAEEAAIWRDAGEAMRAGLAPDSEPARGVVERHRRHVDRWFYPLSSAMHCKLADLWEADERFAQAIDAHGAGLTAWVAAAVRSAGSD